MRRWIAGLAPQALPIAVVCNTLALLMGAAIATVVVARALEPTNGSAGLAPAVTALLFVAGVVLLWFLAQGHLWARILASVISLAAMVFAVIAQAVPMGFEDTIVRLLGLVVIFAAMGFSLLWVPLPERER